MMDENQRSLIVQDIPKLYGLVDDLKRYVAQVESNWTDGFSQVVPNEIRTDVLNGLEVIYTDIEMDIADLEGEAFIQMEFAEIDKEFEYREEY